MKIEIFSDFACPFCYIGQVRLRKALEFIDFKEEIKIIERSYLLNQNAPKENSLNAYESLAKSYNMTIEEAKERIASVEQMGKESGIDFRFDINKPTNTIDAHRILKYAKLKALEEAWLFAVFDAYFTHGLNTANKEVLLDLAKKVGLNLSEVTKILDSDDYLEQIYGDIQLASRRGVRGVPYFLINNRYVVRGAQRVENLVAMLQEVRANEHARTYCDSGTCCL